MTSDDGIRAAIDRIGRLMHGRSPAFADEFAEDAVLVGSEPGEVARGREAIRGLIATFHALPARYTWEWETADIRREGTVAWFFAEGHAVREDPDGATARRPYRLAGVLREEGGRWLWSLFSGSEPKV
jgi:ketosteroid isomerase-like protein